VQQHSLAVGEVRRAADDELSAVRQRASGEGDLDEIGASAEQRSIDLDGIVNEDHLAPLLEPIAYDAPLHDPVGAAHGVSERMVGLGKRPGRYRE
jgi:hypothetical protein